MTVCHELQVPVKEGWHADYWNVTTFDSIQQIDQALGSGTAEKVNFILPKRSDSWTLCSGNWLNDKIQ